jgi:hypothetical protein
MTDSKLTFRREPALIISAIGGAMALVATLRPVADALPGGWDGALVLVVTALAGAWTAARTQPIAPTAFTYLATVVIQALALFHYDLAPATVAAINVAIVAVIALIRGSITPTSDPAPTTPDVGKIR